MAGGGRRIICKELKQFACQFESFHPILSTSIFPNNSNMQHTVTLNVLDEDIMESKDEEKLKLVNCGNCNKCITWAKIIIHLLWFHSNKYQNWFTMYKYLLLLPSSYMEKDIFKTKNYEDINQINNKSIIFIPIVAYDSWIKILRFRKFKLLTV